MIRLLGDLLVEHADPDADFVGHIGGDDFVVLYASSDWRERIDRVLADFAEGARRYFGDEERRLRSFPGRDRDGLSTAEKMELAAVEKVFKAHTAVALDAQSRLVAEVLTDSQIAFAYCPQVCACDCV